MPTTSHRWTNFPRSRARDLHRRGAGVQPGGAARHGASLPAAGLVQDAAAEADHPRGGLPEPHHHQPLLLRTVQLLLHPEAQLPGRGRLSVLLCVQTQNLQHRHVHPLLPGSDAQHQEETDPARKAVPLHDHRYGLDAPRPIKSFPFGGKVQKSNKKGECVAKRTRGNKEGRWGCYLSLF